MSLYRSTFGTAWSVTWRHKILWFFGFLATFVGVGSAVEIIYRSFTLPDKENFFWFNLGQNIFGTGLSFQNIIYFIASRPFDALAAILVTLVFLALALACYWIFTCSQILVIRAFDIIENQKPVWGNLFWASRKYFWRVFGVNIFGKILIGLLLLILSYPLLTPLLNPTFSLPSLLLYVFCFIIIAVLVLIVSLVMLYANIYIATKEKTLHQAAKDAFHLFTKNWLISLEVAISIFFITFAAYILLVFFLTFAYTALRFTTYMITGIVPVLGVVALLLTLIFLLLVIAVFSALLTTWQLGIWVTLFEKLESGEAESKLHRMTENIIEK